MKKKIGKKLVAAGVIAAALAATASCGKKAEETETETSAQESTEAASEAEGESAASEEPEIERPETLGKIKLGDYKGIEVEAEEPYIVTDEDVEVYIESAVLPSYKQPTEDAIAEGDLANIDFVGKMDGVAFDGGTAEGTELTVGAGGFIDGFEDGLIGLKKGDKADIDVTFPDPYENNPDLAGKPAVFEITVNEVKRTPEELTDALTSEIDPECSTAAEYRGKIKTLLQEQHDKLSRSMLSVTAVNKVIENSEFEPTEEAREWITKEITAQYEAMVWQMYGMDFDDMLEIAEQSRDEYVESVIAPVAEDELKKIMVLDEVARLQNMVVTDADYEKLAEDNGLTKEQLFTFYGEDIAEISALEQKAADFIVDNAVVSYIPSETEAADTETVGETSQAEETTVSETEAKDGDSHTEGEIGEDKE